MIFDILDVVEVIGRVAHLIGIAQQHSHQALVAGLDRNDVFAVSEHHARKRDLAGRLDGLADHGIGVVADLAIRHQIVRPYDIKIVDLRPRHELIDVDRAG